MVGRGLRKYERENSGWMEWQMNSWIVEGEKEDIGQWQQEAAA